MEERRIWNEARVRGLPEDGWLLMVDAASQQLAAWYADGCLAHYPVSTGLNGLGSRDGSGCTPPGWHEVAERIGHGAPAGRVFRERVPLDATVPSDGWSDDAAGDAILSRILRLRGLEPGRNAGPGLDSWERLIYIHGTAQEHRLGTPASHGCIRMANRDIIALLDMLGLTPAWCWIG